MSLTAAGKRLLPYAGRVHQVIAEARQAVADDCTAKGPLVIGSLETTADDQPHVLVYVAYVLVWTLSLSVVMCSIVY